MAVFDHTHKRGFWRIEGRTSAHLDILRSAAALAVFAGHERNLFFIDFTSVENPNLFVQALYFVTGFGHQAVIVFFVLSGLLISSSILKSMQTGRWDWRFYLTARLSRLLIVLIPALVLGAFWDQLGMLMFGINGIYGANPSVNGNVVTFLVADRSSLGIAIGNALFLQEILVPAFGSNSALWSLSYEFWYYILFPLGLTVFLPTVPKVARLVSGLGVIVVLIFVGPTIALYFAIWLMGAMLAILFPLKFLVASRRRVLLSNVIGLCLVTVCLFGIKANILRGDIQSDFVLSLAVAFLVYSVLNVIDVQTRQDRDAYARIAKSFAGFSYTLYAVHLPLFVFLQAGLLSGKRWQPDARHLFWGLLLFILVLFYAFVVSRLTESRTDDVRRFVLTRIDKSL